jgi:hypothetical protein
MESQHQAHHRSTTPKYSSNLTRSWPPSASSISLEHILQVYLQTRTITASKLVRSWPSRANLQTYSIMTYKCISKLAQSRPPIVSHNTLDNCRQMHLQTSPLTGPEYFSEFTRLSFSDSPRITLKYRLQPVHHV